MIETESQEQYNEAEKEYEIAKESFIGANVAYDLCWAEAGDKAYTIALNDGVKLPKHILEYKLLILQSKAETDLGKAFVNLANARSEKSIKQRLMNYAERTYWNTIR